MKRGFIFFYFLVFFMTAQAQEGAPAQASTSPQNPSGANSAGPALSPSVTGPRTPPTSSADPGLSENQATASQPEVLQEKYNYDETEGRDPFRIPRNVITTPGGVTIVENEDSLEGAPIPFGVKVLAIIYDARKPRALIRKLSSGKTYTAYLKSRVGQGGGIVKEITEDEVIVQRSVEVEGETKVELVSLRLKEKDLNK